MMTYCGLNDSSIHEHASDCYVSKPAAPKPGLVCGGCACHGATCIDCGCQNAAKAEPLDVLRLRQDVKISESNPDYRTHYGHGWNDAVEAVLAHPAIAQPEHDLTAGDTGIPEGRIAQPERQEDER